MITKIQMLATVGFAAGVLADEVFRRVRAKKRQKEKLLLNQKEMEQLQKMGVIHDQSMEAKRVELAKIRHDFNNQIAAAYRLMEQGKQEAARELLDGMKAQMLQNREYEYCGNAVVNAVLTDKMEHCNSLNIRMETEVEIGEKAGVQPLHLCSVFSNLLDNAIQAASACKEEERFLAVRASLKGDYLHIKVENSIIGEGWESVESRKSYGQEILKEIAAFYDGEFWTQQQGNSYMACISLLTLAYPQTNV